MKIALAAARPGGRLALLTATYTFSFIDRQIINLLVDPIRADLSLSDSQVSFLQGLAFVLPYVILSIPLGRIVDRANRIRVLVIGILVWTSQLCDLWSWPRTSGSWVWHAWVWGRVRRV